MRTLVKLLTFALALLVATAALATQAPGVITPFLTLYALHDALVKPMPGNAWAPSLAESWAASKDGLTSEFVLRKNGCIGVYGANEDDD